MYPRVRRQRAEGRHDGPAAARGEARQQPRRHRREDADPGPHSKHRPPPEKSSPSMSPAPPPGSFGMSGFFEGVRTSRARRSFAAAAALAAASCAAAAFEAAAASAAAAAAATAALTAAVSVAAASRVDGIFSLVAARPSD